MSNVNEDEEPFWVSDLESIGKPAKTKAERREALDVCLEQFWADLNIGRIERVDEGDAHGWEMRHWRKA
jgi:hypothetical protein